MDNAIQQDALDDSRVDAERQIIRENLDIIAKEVENKLRAAGLSVPVFLTVPNSGNAIATMATPADPQDDLWVKVEGIVIEAVSARLNGARLRSQEMPCAMAAATMSAADLIAD
jgi:hypothetical protein